MPEPTLYQPDFDRMYDDERQMFDVIVKNGRLVPVKRCEHGNIDPHITFINEHGSVTVLKQECPGAGIGGDDETD